MMIIYSVIAAAAVAIAGAFFCTSDDSDRAAEALALIDSGKN